MTRLGVSFEEGMGDTSPSSPDGEDAPAGTDGGQKAFTRTPYRIIQENYKIYDLTDRNEHGIRANKTALTVLESRRNEIESYSKESNFCWEFNIGFNTNLIQDCNHELLRWSNKSFNVYQRKKNEYYSFVAIRNKQDPTKICFIPIETRYNKSYQYKVKKRMNWVIYNYKNAQAVSLTLTIDPKIYAYDKYLMWINIKNELNRFLTDLRYYFKKNSLPFPKYICSIESQKGRPENNYISRGNPHIHIVFLGCKRLLDWRKIRDLWRLGHIWFNRTIEGKKIRYPINYITKYITKTFTETNEENCLTQSLCWIFNVRSFSTSRGLVFPLKYRGDRWEALLLISIKKTINSIDILKKIQLIFFLSYIDPPIEDIRKK
jgi:hypothetical protein